MFGAERWSTLVDRCGFHDVGSVGRPTEWRKLEMISVNSGMCQEVVRSCPGTSNGVAVVDTIGLEQRP